MSKFTVYLVWAFVGLIAVPAIIFLCIIWFGPLFYLISRPFKKIFGKSKKSEEPEKD